MRLIRRSRAVPGSLANGSRRKRNCRNIVREPIRVLSHARVLEIRQGDGTYVRSIVDPGEMTRNTVNDCCTNDRHLPRRPGRCKSDKRSAASAFGCFLDRGDDAVRRNRVVEAWRGTGALPQILGHPGIEAGHVPRDWVLRPTGTV